MDCELARAEYATKKSESFLIVTPSGDPSLTSPVNVAFPSYTVLSVQTRPVYCVDVSPRREFVYVLVVLLSDVFPSNAYTDSCGIKPITTNTNIPEPIFFIFLFFIFFTPFTYLIVIIILLI